MGLFSDVKGMLSQKYEGRYVESVIAFIAKRDPSILVPFLERKADAKYAKCTLEHSYRTERRADLYIECGENAVMVEVKAEDGKKYADTKGKVIKNFNKKQLADYLKWVKSDEEHHKLVLLTKYPINDSLYHSLKKSVDNKTVQILTFSDYAGQIRNQREGITANSLASVLLEYFEDEGLVMHEIKEKDVDAFFSFMVLNFLPHESGYRRQATIRNIENGPLVFSRLVQNWQLTAHHFAERFSLRMKPTVKYWQHQAQIKVVDVEENDPYLRRRAIQRNKNGGSWFIYATFVFEKLRIDFGIEYSVELGPKGKGAAKTPMKKPIKVHLHTTIASNRRSVGQDRYALKDGIYSPELKDASVLVDVIRRSCLKSCKMAIKDNSKMKLKIAKPLASFSKLLLAK